jgi:hypothetical protein
MSQPGVMTASTAHGNADVAQDPMRQNEFWSIGAW